MNVLSLFDGISCGQQALKNLGIKVDNYYACEVDQKSIQVTQHNFPDTIQMGDVTKLTASDLPKIDMVMGGSPCFVAGTKVITKNAYKNIEDIEVGDEVLTHKNRFRKVLKIGGDKNKELFEVKAQGMKPTKVTGNHPYYVREMTRQWDNVDRKYVRVFSDPMWKQVTDLSKGDFIGLPILNTSENPRNLTEEDCWLIGRYIADGHMFKRKRKNRKNSFYYGVVYSVGYSKDVEFESNVTRKYTKNNHTKSVYRFTFSSMEMVELYIELGVGKGAINKTIPMEILNLPKPLLKKVLDGYMSGDGSYDSKHDRYRGGSISEELVMTLALVIAKVHNVNASYEHGVRAKTCVIEGRTVNQNDSYVTTYRDEMKPQSNAIVIDDIIWLPIKSVELLNDVDDVYNMEVDEDNSYTANNIIVHNCQGFSLSGKQLAFDDPRSALFFEFHRIVQEVKPKYFFLENNRMKKEYLEIIDEHMGVTSIQINSALVSAQNRIRHYWTNIPNATVPDNTNTMLKDIIGDYKGIWVYPRGFNKGGVQGYKGKCPTITTSSWEHNFKVAQLDGENRKFTPEECEVVQGLPIGYTSCISNAQRYKKIGNGWTVQVIEHIFQNLK